MTAVNLPDMVQMVREHGLVPVPLDINPLTMAPFGTDSLKKLITPKVFSKFVMIEFRLKYSSLLTFTEYDSIRGLTVTYVKSTVLI